MSRNLAVRSVWMLVVFFVASSAAWAAPIRSGAEVQALVQGLLAGRTPPLEVGTVREVGQIYEVEVVTSGGSLVDRWLVDKATGQLRSLYGRMLLSFQPDAGGGVRPLGWGGGPGWPTFDPLGMMAGMMGGFGGGGIPGGAVAQGSGGRISDGLP